MIPEFEILIARDKDAKNQLVFKEPMPENLLTYLHINCGFAEHRNPDAIKLVLKRLIETGNLYQEEVEGFMKSGRHILFCFECGKRMIVIEPSYATINHIVCGVCVDKIDKSVPKVWKCRIVV
jgi:hypothetical protein